MEKVICNSHQRKQLYQWEPKLFVHEKKRKCPQMKAVDSYLYAHAFSSKLESKMASEPSEVRTISHEKSEQDVTVFYFHQCRLQGSKNVMQITLAPLFCREKTCQRVRVMLQLNQKKLPVWWTHRKKELHLVWCSAPAPDIFSAWKRMQCMHCAPCCLPCSKVKKGACIAYLIQ